MAKDAKRVKAPRATRIDKDVKTTLRHSRVLSFLYDIMWSYRHFKWLALALLLADAVVGYLIIQHVPCTFVHASCSLSTYRLLATDTRYYAQ